MRCKRVIVESCKSLPRPLSFKQEQLERGKTVVTESGNVFANLGLPNPEQRLAKAQLVQRIAEVIKERELTQKQAGTILEIDQAKVSKLARGKLSEFLTSTLIEYLTRLDQDVEIAVRPKLTSKDKASLHVTIPETRLPSETQSG